MAAGYSQRKAQNMESNGLTTSAGGAAVKIVVPGRISHCRAAVFYIWWRGCLGQLALCCSRIISLPLAPCLVVARLHFQRPWRLVSSCDVAKAIPIVDDDQFHPAQLHRPQPTIMKLTLGLVAALAGCAAAAQQAAEVYILPGASQSSTVPSVSRSLARLILLQRLAPAGKGPSTAEIPNGSDAENVVSLISKFGKEPVPLFGQGETLAPSQLVVMLEGLHDDQIKTLGRSFKSGPSFTISDPPSAHANEKLISNDVYNVGVTNDHKCSIKKLSNPFDKNCWSGKSAVAKYNVQKVWKWLRSC
jgi:hypothetical protein